jgi:hypothetical protein
VLALQCELRATRARAAVRAARADRRDASKSRAALLASKRDVERLEAECEALRREPPGELEKLRRENEALRERLAATEAYGAAFKHAHQRRQILDDAVPVVREVVEESDDVSAGCFFNYSIFGASTDDGAAGGGARGVDTVALQADAPEYALANHVDDGDAMPPLAGTYEACSGPPSPRRSRRPLKDARPRPTPEPPTPTAPQTSGRGSPTRGASSLVREKAARPAKPAARAASTPPGPRAPRASRPEARDDHETVVIVEDHVVEDPRPSPRQRAWVPKKTRAPSEPPRNRRPAPSPTSWYHGLLMLGQDLAANPCQPDAIAPPDPVAAPLSPPPSEQVSERSLDDDAIANYLDGALSPSQEA